MPDYTTLRIDVEDRLATITLDHGKVNAIDADLSRDLKAAFIALGDDRTVDGIVLTGRPHCFCAGLNVMKLATSSREELHDFFFTYLAALQTMVRCEKPVVAAVTGFAPAGGTILALAADYRVMGRGDKHQVGMNEFNMSLQIPRMMADIYAAYLGPPRAWADVQSARMYNSDEALAAGLVNESVEVEEVLPRAQAHCRKLMQVHPPVYRRTKRYLRWRLLAAVDHDLENMVKVIAQDFDDPVFKKMMELFVRKLG